MIAGDPRSSLLLWSGIFAGPLAWALDLGLSYALVQWTCTSGRESVLHLITLAAFVITASGGVMSWLALSRTAGTEPTDGGGAPHRARFMALFGLASSALFALTIVAGAVPRWVLDACQ